MQSTVENSMCDYARVHVDPKWLSQQGQCTPSNDEGGQVVQPPAQRTFLRALIRHVVYAYSICMSIHMLYTIHICIVYFIYVCIDMAQWQHHRHYYHKIQLRTFKTHIYLYTTHCIAALKNKFGVIFVPHTKYRASQ